MLIYDDIYTWEGWGGALKLASGKCRLRIYDRSRGNRTTVAFLRPFIVMVSDVADSKMSIRSCSAHIATKVTHEFDIDPDRMLWIEYYPQVTYGAKQEHTIMEQFVAVDFSWHDGKALSPRLRQLNPPLVEVIREIMQAGIGGEEV
jgi:hypothetical protein